MLPGTQGYAEEAESLIARYEAVAFEHKYRAEIGHLPERPCAILDIGAGTGADAAWLSRKGHCVVAVEPVEAFRVAGARLHPSSSIEWVDDGLPNLTAIVARNQQFAAILASAVWMHLNLAHRISAMEVLASLLAPGGVLFMSLRHGRPPQGRTMYEVSAAETCSLATQQGLKVEVCTRTASLQAQNLAEGIEWSRLVFRRPARSQSPSDA